MTLTSPDQMGVYDGLMAKYLFAKYGRYVGQPGGGEDYIIRDPHQFGLEAILWAQYYGEGGLPQGSISYKDTFQINVVKTEGKSLFEDFTVSAPLEIWERILESLVP